VRPAGPAAARVHGLTSVPPSSAGPPAAAPPAIPTRRTLTRAIPPLAVGFGIALIPTPEGLSAAAWSYFALFVAVILAIITEPVPAPVVGLTGVVAAAMLGLVQPTPALSINWALGGFANPLAWLIFSTVVLASGYEKTALGRRIALRLIRRLGRRTLGIGYAIALTDLALAPFTPSNTARSAGTIYPVISNIPGLFDSSPETQPRRIGAYVMYTALAVTCVTSSMFPPRSRAICSRWPSSRRRCTSTSAGASGSSASRPSGSCSCCSLRSRSTACIRRPSRTLPTRPSGRRRNCARWGP
jgi:di/tricarboxylate transporter